MTKKHALYVEMADKVGQHDGQKRSVQEILRQDDLQSEMAERTVQITRGFIRSKSFDVAVTESISEIVRSIIAEETASLVAEADTRIRESVRDAFESKVRVTIEARVEAAIADVRRRL